MKSIVRILAFVALTVAVSGTANAATTVAADSPVTSAYDFLKPVSHPDQACHGATSEQIAFSLPAGHMLESLMTAPTGDADKDFVRKELPVYQMVSDLAQVELEYGKDPALKDLARRILKAHKDELDALRAWRDAHHVPEAENVLPEPVIPPKVTPLTAEGAAQAPTAVQYSAMPFSPHPAAQPDKSEPEYSSAGHRNLTVTKPSSSR